jgi:hypothetical protein
MLYRIQLENKAPLFLQLSQQSSGEVNAVIPNTSRAELAERINVQIDTWCHFYWKETNPGSERFYRKLSSRAFSQVLLHKMSKCTWDSSLKAVTLPSAQSEMSAIAEFEQLDWGKFLTQDDHPQQALKKHVDPNAAFPLQDSFLVGTICVTNARSTNNPTAMGNTEIGEIQDDEDGNNVLTTKSSNGLQAEAVVGNRVTSSSNPISGPPADLTQTGAEGTFTASRGLHYPASTGPAGMVARGGIGE